MKINLITPDTLDIMANRYAVNFKFESNIHNASNKDIDREFYIKHMLREAFVAGFKSAYIPPNKGEMLKLHEEFYEN